MDALLRYSLSHIAYSLLLFEIILMLCCCFAIIVTKLITNWIIRRRERKQDQIGAIIESYLFSAKPIEQLVIPEDLQSFRNLVETLERYDHLFSDPRWNAIKTHIVSRYLMPRADGYASSIFWFRRQLAARSLLLCPSLANETILYKLLEDSRYLVRVAAAACITKTNYRDLFYKMIRKMSSETKLSQFPYRDALIQSSQEKFQWIADLLSSEKDKAVAAICLDALSTRYSGALLHLVKPYLQDPDHECQILALKALGNIPDEESTNLLMNHLNDSDWKVRAEAVLSLQKLFATQAIPKLRELLSDPVWWVRLQAALTLKNFGKEGLEVLTSQSKDNPEAFEIARYTLALP